MRRLAKTPDLKVKAYSVRDISYEGAAYSVLAESAHEPFAILPGHANLLAVLRNSEVLIDTPNGEKQLQIDSGILKVSNDSVTLFINV